MPRGSKKREEVDVTQFVPLVTEALRAFRDDVGYAIAMTKAAATMERKSKAAKQKKADHC